MINIISLVLQILKYIFEPLRITETAVGFDVRSTRWTVISKRESLNWIYSEPFHKFYLYSYLKILDFR